MNQVRQVPVGVDPARPAPARIYDYLLSGTCNFAADREAAERIIAVVPEVRDCAWGNRGFHQRSAGWIARRGIRQFLDIGSGLPAMGNTHDIVQAVDPRCRVVYVDNDRMVCDHAQASQQDRRIRVVAGDLRDPDGVLTDPSVRALIDFSQPVGLLMTAVMHFVADTWEPWRLVGRYREALAPGSFLALSHLTHDHKPPKAVRQFCGIFEHATEQVHFRTRPEVERLFDGLELVPPHPGAAPGLCYVGDWAADDPDLADSDGSRWLYCGVAKVPRQRGLPAQPRAALPAGGVA